MLPLLILTLVVSISSGVAKPIVTAKPDQLLDEEPPGCNHDEVRKAIPMHGVATCNMV